LWNTVNTLPKFLLLFFFFYKKFQFQRFTFRPKHIGFLGETDKDKYRLEGRYVIVQLFTKIPTDDSSSNEDSEDDDDNNEKKDEKVYQDRKRRDTTDSTKYLSKHVLEDFTIKSRQDIVNGTGIPIAFVNEKFVYPTRSNVHNYIIGSISVVFVAILCIVNFVCTRRK
jgi:hypothetical protein